MSFEARNGMSENLPDKKVSVRETFKIDMDMEVPAFSEPNEYVPDFDPDYLFDKDTTLALLAGFAFNRRVIVQGYHGTGKSTHIEQVAARLNWPCIRVNLDSHVSRIDLVGKDAIVVREGMQVTEFKDGILPWAYQHNVALVFDEYERRPSGRHVRDPACARSLGQTDPTSTRTASSARTRRSVCSRRRTRSASATPLTTARSRSTRARWTAGTS